jgi:hypothetical protein
LYLICSDIRCHQVTVCSLCASLLLFTLAFDVIRLKHVGSAPLRATPHPEPLFTGTVV